MYPGRFQCLRDHGFSILTVRKRGSDLSPLLDNFYSQNDMALWLRYGQSAGRDVEPRLKL